MNEGERARLWRQEQARRVSRKRAAEAGMAGDSGAARRVREAWRAVAEWRAQKPRR